MMHKQNLCSARRGCRKAPWADFLGGVCCWHILAPHSLGVQDSPIAAGRLGAQHCRCLGARWDSRCSRSAHTCSRASGSTGSLLECCGVAAFLAEEKNLAVLRYVRSEGIMVAAGLKSASALVWRGAGCAQTSVGCFAGGCDPRV